MNVRECIDELDDLLMQRGAKRELLCSVGGYPVYAYALEVPGQPVVYLSSGVHGDEPAGPLSIIALLKSGVLDGSVSWRICPMLNPTGMELGTRENAQGVDLNRDYLSRRSLEVRAHADWLESFHAELFISLHEDWESSGFYYYEINQGCATEGMYRQVMDSVSVFMPPEPSSLIDDHEVREPGWIYHIPEADEPENWPEAIHMAKCGCPLSFTFETPSSLPLEKRVGAHCAAVISVRSWWLRSCIE